MRKQSGKTRFCIDRKCPTCVETHYPIAYLQHIVASLQGPLLRLQAQIWTILFRQSC